MLPHAWFYRRSCWWLSLAAAVAIVVASAEWMPPVLWCIPALTALALVAGPHRIAAMCLAVATLYGIRTATLLSHDTSGIHSINAVTVRGVVLKTAPAGDNGSRILLDTQVLEIDGFQRRFRERVSATVPQALRPGDVVRLRGRLERPRPRTNPGGFDGRRDGLRRGVALTLHVERNGVQLLGRERLPWWREAALAFRSQVLTRNQATLSPEAALLSNYFLLGDHFAPPAAHAEHLRRLFRESGTIHLLVVSGTQVTLVLGLFVWLGWRVWPLRRGFRFLALVALCGYYLATDGDASVSRAAVMGAVFLGALATKREPDGENCLGIAALVLLAFNPFTLFDIGAQLSFAAVWSLLRLAPMLQSLVAPQPTELDAAQTDDTAALRQKLAGAVAACSAPAIAVAPLLAYYFHTSCWSGILANVVMAPIAAAFLFFAIAHAVLATAGINILAAVVGWMAHALIGWSGVFATPPFGTTEVFPPPLWLLPLCFGLLAACAYARPGSSHIPACLALALAVLLVSERMPSARPRIPTLRVFDVGQGDSLYLEGPDGSRVLIDAGPPGNRNVVRALQSLRVPSLDALVITHGDADHLGGAAEVLRAMRVAAIVHPPVPSATKLWSELQHLAWQNKIPLREMAAGDRLTFARSSLTALWPPASPLRALAANENNNSLVLRWDVGEQRVLLPGDLEQYGEWLLLEDEADVRAPVLKAGHHGGETSTSEEWLEAVRPEFVLISCGRGNRYGHPAPEMLRRLEARHIPVFRTDVHGMITVRLNETLPRVTPYLPAR